MVLGSASVIVVIAKLTLFGLLSFQLWEKIDFVILCLAEGIRHLPFWIILFFVFILWKERNRIQCGQIF